MTWSDADIVLVSAIGEFGYCPRRCGLQHVEQTFEENLFTLRGSQMHERADEPESEIVRGVRIERALPIWSERLGLTGKADVVEFHPDGSIMPVEYKLGATQTRLMRRFGLRPDDLQLTAQVLCLEEMFGCAIGHAAMFHITDRRRRLVEISADLRAAFEDAVATIRAMQHSGAVPPPVDDARCPKCSLIDACIPSVITAAVRRGARGLYAVTGTEGLD